MAEKERIIIDLDFDVTDFTKAAAQLNGEIARLNKEQRELKKQGKEGSIEFQRNSEALRENKKELSDTNRAIQNLTVANKANAGSNEQLKAQLSVLTLEYNQMSKAQREGTEAGKNLTAQIDQITSELKGSEEAVGNHTRSVGDYEKGTKRLEAELKGLRKEFNSLSKEEQNNTQVGGVLIQKIEETNNELILSQKELDKYNSMLGKSGGEVQGFGKALEGTPFGAFISGIKSMGAAFLANPIGLVVTAIVGAFALLYKAFTRTEEGSNKLNKVMGALGAVFSGVMKVLEPVANFIFDVIIKAFDDLGKAADAAMAIVASGLDLLGFDNAAKGVRDFVQSSQDMLETSQQLAEAEAELTKVRREQRIVQLEAQNAAEKQRQIRDDESKSIEERKKANEELGRILEEQSAKELAIAQKAMEVALLRQKVDGDTTEVLDEIAQAKLELIDIEERITGQQSEQLVNINSLNRDAAQQAKDAAAKVKERLQQEIENNKKAIDLFILQQGTKAKSLEEELKLAEDVSNKRIEILDKELKAKLINQTQYDIELINIQNDLLSAQTNLSIDNAQRELDIIIQNNQTKIDNNQFLNDELYQQELTRLDLVAQAQRDFAQTQLKEGVISQQEYNDAIAEVNNENDKLKADVVAQKKEAETEARIADLELQREIDQENHDFDLEFQLAQFDADYEKRKAAAKKQGADMLLFEQANAKARGQIEKQVNDNKIALASQTFGNLAEIVGKETKAGKAFAIAQTTIDTFVGAQKAFNSLAGIPIVGAALGAVAAAAAVASGIARVNQIRQTKAAKGGVFGGRAHSSGGTKGYFSDGTEIEVEKGELFAVVNKKNTAMLGQLSALNSFGGNGTPYFAKGGVQTFADGGVSLRNVSGTIDEEQKQTNNMLKFIEALPSPVVAVQDINEVQSEYNRVQTRAIL